MLGKRERAPSPTAAFTLDCGSLCFFQKRGEYSGVSAFMPMIPLMAPQESRGGNGSFSNSETEGLAVLEVVMAVAVVIGLCLVTDIQWSHLKLSYFNQVCSQ